MPVACGLRLSLSPVLVDVAGLGKIPVSLPFFLGEFVAICTELVGWLSGRNRHRNSIVVEC